jgi:hypothetical protein
VRFLGLAVAVLLAAFALGYRPTERLAGGPAVAAMAAGGLVSFVGAALAGWLLVALEAGTPTARLQRAGLAMSVRLAVAVALGLAVMLGGGLARRPLLFWLSATYMALLPLEVKLAVSHD